MELLLNSEMTIEAILFLGIIFFFFIGSIITIDRKIDIALKNENIIKSAEKHEDFEIDMYSSNEDEILKNEDIYITSPFMRNDYNWNG